MLFDELEFPTEEELKKMGRTYGPGHSANIIHRDGTISFVDARSAPHEYVLVCSLITITMLKLSLFELALHLQQYDPIPPDHPHYDGVRHAKTNETS